MLKGLVFAPGISVMEISPSRFELYTATGWTISVIWGHSDILAPVGKADVFAFKGQNALSAEKTYVPEGPLTLPEVISLVNELSGKND